MYKVAQKLRDFLCNIEAEIWILLALSSFAWMPLLAPGYFLKAHDAPHTLFFLNQFHQGIQDGYWIPRWGPDFAMGYGYPLFIFYSPLAYYIAEIFHLLGANITWAIKITYVLGFLVSGQAMYALARHLFGRSAGLLAGLLYVYMPYHLLDVYVRSDLAEATAYAILPLVLHAFLGVVEHGSRRNTIWAALSYAALILTHNGTVLIFTPFLMLFVLAFLLRRGILHGLGVAGRAGGHAIFSALLGGGVSAFFLLPALFERHYIVQEQWIQGSFHYMKHFVYASQLFSSFWGYGYAGEGLADEMSFQLGLVPVLLSCAGIVFGWRRLGRRGMRLFLIVTTLGIIVLMLPISAPVWERLPLAALVQFPWRLLILTSVTLALLGGIAGIDLTPAGDRMESAPAAMVVGIAIVLASFPYTLPQYTERSLRSEQPVAVIDFELVYPPDRTGMVAWTQEQPTTSPLVPQYLAGEPLTKAHAISGTAEILSLRRGGGSEEIMVRAETPATIEFSIYYYPGWRATVDGVPVDIRPSGRFGLIALDIPAGEHRVLLRFGDTPLRTVGKIISAISAAVCIVALSWPRVDRIMRRIRLGTP